MANVKITYIFNAGRTGWSETWYSAGTTIEQAMSKATLAGDARADLLGKGAILEAIRCSDEQVPGDSLLLSQYNNLLPASPDNPTRDTPWNAWLVTCRATPLYRRNQWLRGISDSWIEINPTDFSDKLVGTFLTKWNAWVAAFKKAQFSIRAYTKDPGQAPDIAVGGVAASTANGRIITAPGHGLINGDKIRIRGCQGQNVKGANGLWTVFGRTDDTFTVMDVSQPPGNTVYTGGGKIRKRILVYPVITDLQLLRYAKRNTGRAFFVPRGRRRVVRK